MRKGFTLIEVIIVVAIIAVIAAIAIPGLLAAQRAGNERNASASLKTFGTAEADFRANDRDNNRVNDFWTADVAGLYLVVPAAADGNPPADLSLPNAIRLIEMSVAAADGEFSGASYTSFTAPVAVFNTFQPKVGYWYRALANDRTGGGMVDLTNDTDGVAAFNDCHHNDRYAFAAFPISVSTGQKAFILNQEHTVLRINVTTAYQFQVTVNGATSTTIALLGGTGNAELDGGDYPNNPTGSGFAKLD